ncbi:hypothetical protein [Methylobacterium mesophilicum]
MSNSDGLTTFEAAEKQRLLTSVEALIASLPRVAPLGMLPIFYESDRKGFYRERDRLRAELSLPPGAPDPLLRGLMRAARAD